MGQSYRIRTTPGQDKNIQVLIDQDFEQLEILSLKIRQQDVYTRMCSDYGVIAGRVFSNNGYGIPNAKVSIFIPILPEDEENPVINAIYPYKNLEQRNEDGYVYNLLPYVPSYSQHVPTGTFPTRTDALTNQTVVELYDKYYRFTVSTNDSGDFLIFGVPTGTQTLVMNVDLSDIGPFSLSPQDLVRMGVANEEQFDGVKFKASSNFNELPQIITINKTIEILPFWGQPEVCQIGINRVDFDLTGEANIDIKPTAIFMGSLMSSNEKSGVRQNGRAQKGTGELCKMISGPGEIIGITQTIFQDSNGLPVLERANLPNGGRLIDGDGTWLFDIPMNLDYVYTNEFGDLVLSEDPSVGVPTKGKYRFKIKWQQSKNINEDYKRGYYLVPNVKEKGWDSNFPNNDPLSGQLGVGPFYDAQSSYAFSLDWSAYTTSQVSVTNPDILSIINCEDYFYEYDYNKVYTVSQFIDLDKRRKAKERFIGIKRIDDNTCEDTSNPYPVNDGVFHTSIQWIINNIIITIIGILLFPILLAYSIVAFILNIVWWIITKALCAICRFRFLRKRWFEWVCKGLGINCDDNEPLLGPLKFPMLNYPDCDVCECDNDSDSEDGVVPIPPTPIPAVNSVQSPNFFTSFNEDSGIYEPLFNGISNIFQGFTTTDYTPVTKILQGSNFRPTGVSPTLTYRSNDLPFAERINSFNTKGKYYDDNGGTNQISVKYNPSNSSNINSHYDNIIVIIVPTPETDTIGDFSASTSYIFVDSSTSLDPNITGSTPNIYGTKNTTGTTVFPSTINIKYADPTNKVLNSTVTYQLPNNFTDVKLYAFPSDTEIFQVITGMTMSSFITKSNTNPKNGSLADIMKGKVYIYKTDSTNGNTILSAANFADCIDTNGQYVVLLQRGVDPYSPLYNTQIGLGKIFGFDNHNAVLINADYRLNIPVQSIDTSLGGGINDEICFENNLATDNATPNNGQNIFFPSYIFTPGNYIPYTTNNLRYYSRLDTTIAGPPPPPVFVSNPLSNYVNVGPYNNANDLSSKFNNGFYFGQPNSNNDGKIFYFNTTQSNTLGVNKSTSLGSITQSIPGYSLSGSLIVGQKYKIVQYNSGDNFIPGGASSNASGVIFTYNGGTITWTNLSRISRYVTVGTYTTASGSPNQTSIPSNNWRLNFVSTSIDSYVHFEVYKKDLSNTETFLFQSNEVNITTPQVENVLTQLAPAILLLPTDRIVVKFVAINTDLSSRNLTIYTDNRPQTYLLTSFNRDDAKYILNESLVGGSYLFMDGSGNSTTFSPIYPSFTTTMSNSNRIVMRGDRLPSTETITSGDNSPLLQQNTDAIAYKFNNGIAQTTGSLSTQQGFFNSSIDPSFTADTAGLETNILSSFTCSGMRDLDCYQGNGLSFGIDPNCSANGKVVNGCYILVDRPLFGLFGPNGDIKQLSEYIYRFKFYYALCQGVIGNVFINNWINGNLYAFPFKVNTFYNKLNQVRKRVFPTKVVMLQYESNNFYYRSSPYTIQNQFIGSPSSGSRGANARNLKYPTTIMNLGPRSSFLQEIILNGGFNGYNVDKLTSTSHNNQDDVTSLFAITRMVNKSFFSFISTGIRKLFSRDFRKVDADFAQTSAVNTQVGVIPLDSEYYTSVNPNPSIIVANAGTNNPMMGIYFDSSEDDLQVRDYISPGRTIRYNPNNGLFRYDYQSFKSQVVPNYKWNIQPGGLTIFGLENNDWATSITDIEVIKYQSMDRIANDYPRGAITNDWDYRGYLFGQTVQPIAVTSGTLVVGRLYTITDYNLGDDFINVGASSNATGVQFTAIGTTPTAWTNGSTLESQAVYQTTPYLTPNPALGGAPWYFYFGLTKGNTALNRFFEKYVGQNTLNE